MAMSTQLINLMASLMLLIAFAMLAQRRILSLIYLFAWQGAVRQYIASLAARATIEGFSFEPETASLARPKPAT